MMCLPLQVQRASIVFPLTPLTLGRSELLLHSKPKLPGRCHSLLATRFVDVPPLLRLTLFHFKLVFKPGGVKVRFATPIQGSLIKTEVRIFGYLVAVAGVARSLGSDSTKIVNIDTAILAACWTRLLAAATVNGGPSNAHLDLLQVGDGGQLLWADALSRKGVCGEIIWSCSSTDFRTTYAIGCYDRVEVRERDHFWGNRGQFGTSIARVLRTVHTVRNNG